MKSTIYHIETPKEKCRRILNDVKSLFNINLIHQKLMKWEAGYEYSFENRIKQTNRDWNNSLNSMPPNYTIYDFLKNEMIQNEKSLSESKDKNTPRRTHTCEQYKNILNELTLYIENNRQISKGGLDIINQYFPTFFEYTSIAKERLKNQNNIEDQLKPIENKVHSNEFAPEKSNKDSLNKEDLERLLKKINTEELFNEYIKRFPTNHPDYKPKETPNIGKKTFTINYLSDITTSIIKANVTSFNEKNIIASTLTKNSISQTDKSLTIYNRFIERKVDNTLDIYKKVPEGIHNPKTILAGLDLLHDIAKEIIKQTTIDRDLLKEALK